MSDHQSFAFGYDSKSTGKSSGDFTFIPDNKKQFICLKSKSKFEKCRDFFVYTFKKLIGRKIF